MIVRATKISLEHAQLRSIVRVIARAIETYVIATRTTKIPTCTLLQLPVLCMYGCKLFSCSLAIDLLAIFARVRNSISCSQNLGNGDLSDRYYTQRLMHSYVCESQVVSVRILKIVDLLVLCDLMFVFYHFLTGLFFILFETETESKWQVFIRLF